MSVRACRYCGEVRTDAFKHEQRCPAKPAGEVPAPLKAGRKAKGNGAPVLAVTAAKPVKRATAKALRTLAEKAADLVKTADAEACKACILKATEAEKQLVEGLIRGGMPLHGALAWWAQAKAVYGGNGR